VTARIYLTPNIYALTVEFLCGSGCYCRQIL